jgi:hypothetical protein
MHEDRPVIARAVPTNTGSRSSLVALGTCVGTLRRSLRRACPAAVAVSMFPFLNGCYSYQRVATTQLPPGTDVSLTITDQGRVGLGDRMGAGVMRVNGRVVDPSDSAWVVRVSSVEMLAGGKTNWSGEEVRLPRAYVGEVGTRDLSRKKTLLAAGVAIGAVAATVAAVSLIAHGFEGSDATPPRDGATSRIPSPTPAVVGRP